jgi:hypothetical protein
VRAFGKNGVALTAIIHLTVFALNLFTCPPHGFVLLLQSCRARTKRTRKVSITIFEIVTRRQRAFFESVFVFLFRSLRGVGEAKSAQNFFQ